MNGPATRVELTSATFEDLFGDEYPPLVLVLQVLTGDRQRAEDLAGGALARAAPSWESESGDPPTTLVWRWAVEASAPSRWRRRSSSTHRGPGDELLWQTLRDLPAKQRWAVALHYVGGVPIVQVASVLGCSTRAAGAHLARALTALDAHTGEVRLEGEPTSMLDDPIHDQLVAACARLTVTRPDRAATRAALEQATAARPTRRPQTAHGKVIVIGLAAAVLAVGALVNSRALSDEPSITITIGPELQRVDIDAQASEVDFDGDGGACLTVNQPGSTGRPAVGCMIGAERRSGRPLAARLGSRWIPIVDDPSTLDIGSVGPTIGRSCAGTLPKFSAPTRPVLVSVVACDRLVPSLYGVLPRRPGGTTRWKLVGDDMRVHSMSARRAADPYLLFETVPIDEESRCLVVASSADVGSWAENCGTSSDEIAVARLGTTVVSVDPLASQVSAVDEARLDIGGCRTDLPSVLAAMPAGAMVTRLACRDGFAVAEQVPTRLGEPHDGAVYALAQRANGSWVVAAQGPTYICPTLVFCKAFRGVDVLGQELRPTPIN